MNKKGILQSLNQLIFTDIKEKSFKISNLPNIFLKELMMKQNNLIKHQEQVK